MNKMLAALLALLIAANAEASIRTGGAAGAGGGGGAVPGGSTGQLQYNNGGGTFGGLTLNGDCTLVYTTGAITCTKTNGVNFGSLATASSLPNPSASTLGGVQSITPVANNFLTSISTSGVPAQAQPSTGNLSDISTFNLNTTGTAATATSTITSSAASALAVGQNGATAPAFVVNASTASSGSGLSVKSAAAGSGVTLAAVSSGGNESMTITTKGSGALNLNGLNGTLLQSNSQTRVQVNTSQILLTPGLSNSAANPHMLFTGTADAAATASTEAPNIYFNMGQTRTHATGAITTQRDFRISPNTHAFAGASALTTAATLSIDGAPLGGTNATITNSYGLYIPTQTAANTTNAVAARFDAPTGASSTNYALQTTGSANMGPLISGGTTFTATGCAVSNLVGGAASRAIYFRYQRHLHSGYYYKRCHRCRRA